MRQSTLPAQLASEVQAAWRRYLDLIVPLRARLYGYCRGLTGNPWDAEDLVEDTLLKGFSTLGLGGSEVANPEAYLLRTASNHWIDTMRRRSLEAAILPLVATTGSTAEMDRAADLTDASAVLLGELPHRERCAVLLKDVMDLSLAETAEVLETTPNAVKAALHRGRTRLRDLEAASGPRRTLADPGLVQQFVDRLNAADLPGLLELMLPNGSVRMLNASHAHGREQFGRTGSWLWHAVFVHPDLPADRRPPKWVNEVAEFEGEPLIVSTFPGQRLVTAITRLECEEGRIRAVVSYQFSPEVVREVAAALGLEAASLPYRFGD